MSKCANWVLIPNECILYAYNFILLANGGNGKCFQISRNTHLANDAAISYGFCFSYYLDWDCVVGICVQMCNICQDCIRLWVQENCTHIKEIMPVLMIIMILCKTIVSAKSIRHPKIQNYLMEKYFDIYIYIYIYI